MTYRPAESLKAVAEELADLLQRNSGNVQRKEELVKQLSPLGDPAIDPGAASSSQEESNAIGVWMPSPKNEHLYVRDVRKRAEWHFWADLNGFPAKGNGARIVLLGESVARAAFYDPCYTVAGELEAILSLNPGLDAPEVIDLAKTGIFVDELIGLIRQCRLLKPDAVVVFAGNNLVFSMNEDEQGFRRLYENFRENNDEALASAAATRLQQLVQKLFDALHRELSAHGIPVVYVIPEYNLKDWKSNEQEQILPVLSEDNMSRWQMCKETACQCLQNGALAEAERRAQEMILLDPSNPLGYELLGEYYLRNHQWQMARKALEAARDTALVSRGIVSRPRCYKVVQDAIRSMAKIPGIQVVDLPAIFEKHVPQLPDRHYFMDYCHLTVPGIKLAMRYTAQALMRVLAGLEIPETAIKDAATDPAPEVHSVAHLCAAIHNAHYGQGTEILKYHCGKAVHHSRDIGPLIGLLCDFSTRKASTLFCSAFEQMIIEGQTQQSRSIFSLVHPRGKKLMDVALIDAFVEALSAQHSDIETQVNQLRLDQHQVGREKMNLLQSWYSTGFYKESPEEISPVFMRIRNTTSVFQFVCSADELQLELVYRTPFTENARKTVTIKCNDFTQVVVQAPATTGWCRLVFTIPAAMLMQGVNQLYIHWPYLDRECYDNSIQQKKYTYFDRLYPVVGEISSLTVKCLHMDAREIMPAIAPSVELVQK